MSLFPSLPDEAIKQILIRTDDDTFDRLSSEEELERFFTYPIIENIYEQKSRNRFSNEIVNLNMDEKLSWKEFYKRVKFMVYDKDKIKTWAYYDRFIIEGCLLEFRIYTEIGNKEPSQHYINMIARNGHLHLLKYVYAKNPNIELPDVGNLTFIACNGHLDVLKFIYEINGTFPNNNGLNWARNNGHLDILDWVNKVRNIGREISPINQPTPELTPDQYETLLFLSIAMTDFFQSMKAQN